MKAFVIVILVSIVLGGFVGGEVTDRTFLLTGAVIGGVGVSAVLLGLGAFFSWQDDRKKRAALPALTPEMRGVFDRMFKSQAGTPAAQSKSKPQSPVPSQPPATGSDANIAVFKKTVAGLVATQLLPAYAEPREAFGALMTNKQAAGYLFGMHDAMLQACDLRQDLTRADKLLDESYQAIFGTSAGHAMFSMSLHNQHEADFAAGRMEGGEELTDFIDNKVPPLGLGRMLILGQRARLPEDSIESGDHSDKSASAPGFPSLADSAFGRLMFEIERTFRRTVQVPSPEDTVDKVFQRSSIYGAISPFTYALVVLKCSGSVPDFVESAEHAEFYNMVETRLVESRTRIADLMAKALPSSAGVNFQADVGGIKKKAEADLLEALAAIATDNTARPPYIAKPNLLQVFVANAPFTPSPESKEKLYEAMEAFVDDFLKLGKQPR